jgi:anti-anti-sigma regulatory factor
MAGQPPCRRSTRSNNFRKGKSMENNFKMELKRGYDADFVKLSGTIDYEAGNTLEELSELVSRPKIRFDFSRVGRINSMGIAFILRCFKKLRDDKNTEISLTGLNSMHTMLFKMTGVFYLATPES